MINGLTEALADLQSLPKKAVKAMRKGERVVAARIVNDAILAAPVDSGGLISEITFTQTQNETEIIGGDKFAAYQEFGTGPLVSIPDGLTEDARLFYVNGKGHTPPHPFFFPAVFKHRDEIYEEVDKELQDIIK